ncbi:hypothetical protein [Sandaracinus amylolyticus]|uniref:Ferritin-like domain-containing protein n=1 Tax=Sandaracinus amylolyticus TaxID=927083 RepID=A0A0F6YL81_9BACT|nr:hypothetical protein [Sandaracinus amylolyticus]AKF08020.1 hypothetical protein DB32_005169 [Sandaracinus amylolyticus]
MDVARMLEMCRRDQWRIEDLDWSVTPRALSREDEIAVCQYFTDMSGIELLAGALFEVQRDQARDATLRKIFSTFVVDEERHSRVATLLARHYDVHRYQRYELNPHLVRFQKHFVNAVQHLAPDIANAYITTGELLLDVALLRSLDDYVDDEMSHQAMKLINRDESRHIAVDYHMSEYYASPEYEAWLASRPKKSVLEEARAAWALVGFMYHAQPFFRDVFFRPMELVDPTNRRLIEAFKRIQLLGRKTDHVNRPFTRFLRALQDLFNHPVSGPILGPAISRIMGVDPKVIRVLYDEEEERRARAASFDALAQEALEAKTLS